MSILTSNLKQEQVKRIDELKTKQKPLIEKYNRVKTKQTKKKISKDIHEIEHKINNIRRGLNE